ncbi:MAG: hypothetical protein LBQ63_07570 [Deltaproteobacteria bacterium]|jgi:hypothetical protein|nr:hypothetical protein [Deltaproteobacteria bacterium]
MIRVVRFRSFLSVSALLLLFASSACSSLQGLLQDDNKPDYFYSEFEDIPIPRQMDDCTETNVFSSRNNLKTGVQVFKGRVEAGSLLRTIQTYMDREGWVLLASTRGSNSLLLFDKGERYAVFHVLDGRFYTEMQIYVTSKLAEPLSAPSANSQILNQ